MLLPSSAWMAAGACVTPMLSIPTQRGFSAARPFQKKNPGRTKKQIQIKSWSLFHRDLGELLRREAYKHRTAPKSDAWFKNVNDAFLFSWGL